MRNQKAKTFTGMILAGTSILALAGGLTVFAPQAFASVGHDHNHQLGPWNQSYMVDLFNRIDTNSDHKIDRAELDAYQGGVLKNLALSGSNAVNADQFINLYHEQVRPTMVSHLHALYGSGASKAGYSELSADDPGNPYFPAHMTHLKKKS